MRFFAVTIIAAALCAFAAPRPSQADETPYPANERRTLSLRTAEGMVVVDCLCAEIDRVTKKLAAETSPPSDNRGLFLWLVEAGVPPEALRMYVSDRENPEVHGLPEFKWKSTTVAEAVHSGEIPDISGRELYEAYMIIRATGAEVYLDETMISQTAGPSLLPHTVFVLSSGYVNGYHGIFVDGTDYSKDSSSYNIVTFSPDGVEVTASAGFNMFESPEAGEKMAAFLNALPDGTIILASIKRGPGVFLSAAAINALRAFGSGVSLDPEVLSSHAMIGKKGWAPGEAIEATAVNMGSRAIYFEDRLYANPALANEETSASGGRSIILSGSAPESMIYIYGGM